MKKVNFSASPAPVLMGPRTPRVRPLLVFQIPCFILKMQYFRLVIKIRPYSEIICSRMRVVNDLGRSIGRPNARHQTACVVRPRLRLMPKSTV